MHHHHNCKHSRPNCYRYKGCWIEIFLKADFESDRILYTALVELPNKGGVISGEPKESRDEAGYAAKELIDSWN